ncbi:hypothetical protein RFI_07179 [Reticulomyxa filosa]|uniref:Alcohol dehydrogenase-like C-terminal domain-containing protein n=1 Tax=Reticulomyxa filosa TaxID=46433 RepID=X6NVB6_RETFI|nr:hypothetical protein RFI_07179 [Reticulomyxa filosa]|eukprot:ETO29941.1 hypothetical protein RFI_07179 [Reticulomyxa filosa]
MAQFGHGKGTIYGGCSEYFIVKEIYCYRLRTNISWKEAALLEPLGVAHNAIEQVETIEGEVGKKKKKEYTVDTIFLNYCCHYCDCKVGERIRIAVAKALGCRKVIASDVLPWKLELAKKMGADELINVQEQDLKTEVMKLTNGIGVQAMIECSGISEVTNMSFSLLRKGGHIVLVGLPKQPLHVENVLKNMYIIHVLQKKKKKKTDVIFKSLQLRTIHGRRIFHTWKEVEKLIAEGKIPTSLVVSHYLPLSEWKKGYDALLSGEACKVLFDPTL